MRILAALAISLVTAAAIFVAGFALLHGMRSPAREVADDTRRPEIPPALEMSIDAIDRTRRSVQFEAADASTQARHVLSGTCAIPSAQRLILRRLSGSHRVLTETTLREAGYRFEAMPQGTYELRVLDARGKPLRNIARIDLFGSRRFDLDRKEQIPINVDVRRAGKALAGAFVILVRGRERIASGTTNATGRLRVDALESGELSWRVWWGDGSAATEEWSGQSTLRPTDTELRLDIEGP